MMKYFYVFEIGFIQKSCISSLLMALEVFYDFNGEIFVRIEITFIYKGCLSSYPLCINKTMVLIAP